MIAWFGRLHTKVFERDRKIVWKTTCMTWTMQVFQRWSKSTSLKYFVFSAWVWNLRCRKNTTIRTVWYIDLQNDKHFLLLTPFVLGNKNNRVNNISRPAWKNSDSVNNQQLMQHIVSYKIASVNCKDDSDF